MDIVVRGYTPEDLEQMRLIWNAVVEEGMAFPQEEELTPQQARHFFEGQSYTGVACSGGEVLGLYILHPNNVGRCGHIANTSYAVKAGQRGKQIGRRLVRHSMATAAGLGFTILQFNAVVASNHGAIHLYKKLGFTQLGVIPKGFKTKSGRYEDILPFYIALA